MIFHATYPPVASMWVVTPTTISVL